MIGIGFVREVMRYYAVACVGVGVRAVLGALCRLVLFCPCVSVACVWIGQCFDGIITVVDAVYVGLALIMRVVMWHVLGEVTW